MKKVIRTLFAIVISTTFVNAQNTVNKKLDEVVVSANRASSTENTSNVQIISLEEIQNAPVQTIEDLLEYAINVDVRQRRRTSSASRHKYERLNIRTSTCNVKRNQIK